MSCDTKSVLRRNYEYLVEHLNVLTYMDALFSKEVVTFEEKEDISKETTKHKQARKFLDLLLGKPEEGIENFFEILKTRHDKQPHIYEEMFPESCTDLDTNGTGQQDKGFGFKDGVAAANSCKSTSSHGRESSKAIPQLNELVLLPDKKFTLILALSLDKLRLKGHLTLEEYKMLHQGSLQILCDILESKGESSVVDICNVLLDSEDCNTVGTIVSPENEIEVNAEDQSPVRQRSDSPLSVSQLTSAERMVSPSTPIASRKQQHISEPLKRREANPAAVAFFFKQEYKRVIKSIEAVIRSMCCQHFGIDEKYVTFFYLETAQLNTLCPFREDQTQHPCYVDVNSKLAVLMVDGIERNQAEYFRRPLEMVLKKQLKEAKSQLALPLPDYECSVCVLDIAEGSACFVLLFSIDLFISLLYVLGDSAAWAELRKLVQKSLPGSTKAVFRLGGLPPVRVYSYVPDARQLGGVKEVFLGDQRLVNTERESGTISVSIATRKDENYGNAQCERDLNIEEIPEKTRRKLSSLEKCVVEGQTKVSTKTDDRRLQGTRYTSTSTHKASRTEFTEHLVMSQQQRLPQTKNLEAMMPFGRKAHRPDSYRGDRYVEEAKLFYSYLVTEKLQPGAKVHVCTLRDYHDEWVTEHPSCRWRHVHETMKRHKALKKSGKGGYFKLTREWPEGSSILGGLQKGTDSEEASVTQSILQRFRENKSALLLNKHGVEIYSKNQDTTGHSIDVVVVQEASGTGPAEQASATASLEIINKSSSGPVQFRACGFLKHDQAFTLYDDRQVSGGLGDVTLERGQSYTVTCRFSPQGIGVHSDIVAFTFATTDESGKREFFHIVRYVKGRCTTNMAEEIRSKDKYRRQKYKRPTVSRSVEPGEPPEGGSSHLSMVIPLDKYGCEAIAGMIQNGQPSEKLREILSLKLEEHHGLVFRHLLWVEEAQMNIDIRHYDMHNATMQKVPGDHLSLKVPGLAEKRPSLLKRDRLYVSNMESDKEFEGYVHQICQDEVWLKFSARFHRDVYLPGKAFDVRFTFNRLPLKLQHRAIAKNPLPTAVLFPRKETIGTLGCLRTGPITRFFDRKVEQNSQQKTAVERIVSGSSRPGFYIIFGPPGTGKTTTTVEAIRQVLGLLGNTRVLVCAPSNSAADLVCQRLLEVPVVSKNQILRLNAVSRDERDIPQKLKENSKYDLSIDDLMSYKVVVSTLVTAGKIVSAGVPRGHFSHIFVDESGHAVEPECLIPIVGLSDPGTSQIILAGDPQQLGPVLRSQIAIKYGLQVSLLERLMNNTVYQRCGDSFDANVVTKLLKNYRSHPAILDQPNRMFYENELIPSADVVLRNRMCTWEGLVKREFPLIFHGVVGEENQEANSPSFFNPEEVNLVCDYLKRLKETRGACSLNVEKDVGIITPYRKQVQKIRRCLERQRLGDAKVGSVEEFQGQERTVIIISTVRSNPDYLEIDQKFNLGFLRNPKRFNVAVTRAKALLIVIGNPHLLLRDKHWKQFIEYIYANGGYKGCPYPDEDLDEDAILENLQELELHTEDAYEAAAREEESQLQQFIEPEWRGEH